MANDTLCRFRLRLVVNGFTQLNGLYTRTALSSAINVYMRAIGAPLMDFSILDRYLKGAYLHYDTMLGETLLAFEIEVVESPAQIKPTEPA